MKKILFAAAIVFALPGGAVAQSLAIGPTAAAMGAGGDIPIQINRTFTINVNGNQAEYATSQQMGGLNYAMNMNLMGGGATVDIHPFQNGFLISAGYYMNTNEVELSSTPAGQVRIGNGTYTAAQCGQIQGALTMASFVPFVGVGYDTTFHGSGALSFSVRAGAFIVGDVDASLKATGSLANDPSFLANLQAEAESIETAFTSSGILPVISVGIRYQF